MDINDLRAASTVLVAVAFVAVCWWAYSPKRRKKFEEAAQLPFADDPGFDSGASQQKSKAE